MRIGAALLANAAEVRDGLIYLMGGGWDTVTILPGAPLGFRGVVVVRLLAQRHECNRVHEAQIVCEGEDGERVFAVNIAVAPTIPEGHPLGWEIPVNIVANVAGPLPHLGLYQFSILEDGNFLGSLPMRASDRAPQRENPRQH